MYGLDAGPASDDIYPFASIFPSLQNVSFYPTNAFTPFKIHISNTLKIIQIILY